MRPVILAYALGGLGIVLQLLAVLGLALVLWAGPWQLLWTVAGIYVLGGYLRYLSSHTVRLK